jgi:serine/threonine-protein kinase PknG
MTLCTLCRMGHVRDGFCDYCGFEPPPASSPRPPGAASAPGTPSARSRHTPRDPPRDTWAGTDRRAGTGRSVPRPRRYGPLEMAGVPPVPLRAPETVDLSEPSGSGPRLRRGELVGGQYDVRGCLAHGGVGRLYLAYDNNVGHWVVLKGLLDGRADTSDVPEAERAALAAVNDPNIVKIHNFVQHPVPTAGADPEDTQRYIVMEYVGGRSLKELLDERRRDDPEASLPVDRVIAYGIEMLRALGYLHSKGLLYCDLKPANVMQSEHRIILVDLGGARRMNSGDAPIYGTPGYMPPEVPDQPPSVRSDLYTVGRTMAVLSFPFDHVGEYAADLPPREEVEVLRRFESYDRLLRRATHREPGQRFADAAEMEAQLFGVLREVVSAPRNAEPWPVPSTLFGRERRVVGADAVTAGAAGPVLEPLTPGSAVRALPSPVVSESDETPGLVELAAHDPREIIAKLAGPARPPVTSLEDRLVLAGAHLDVGALDTAGKILAELAEDRRRAWREDWRIQWYQAVGVLAGGDHRRAGTLFDRLYTRMPGEAAPKLALAFCREGTGKGAGEEARHRFQEAARYYESVWRTDRGYLSAAFGLARVRLALGDRDGAVRALEEVPSLSRHYGAAQLAAMAADLRGRPPAELSEAGLLAAAARLDQARVDGERRRQLVAELLEAGLAWVRAGGTEDPGTSLVGAPLTQKGLRRELEQTYRALVRYTDDTDARYALVDKANEVRPPTFF